MRSSFALIAIALAACGNSDHAADLGLDEGMPDFAPSCLCAMHTQFVIDSMRVPKSNSEFAVDLNGDGTPDDQLGTIAGALEIENLDPQVSVDDALANGTEVVLIEERSDGEVTSANAITMFERGDAMNPDAGTNYVIDSSISPSSLVGAIDASVFQSTPPAMNDLTLTLPIPLFEGVAPLVLTLHGARVRYTNATGALTLGQINGAITKQDMDTIVVPAVAQILTNKLHDPATSASTKQQIKSTFDIGDGNGGNCTNPDGSVSMPNDGAIGACEVLSVMIIANLLSPDVQLFQNGAYAPNPANAKKDSVSVGLGFTARSATF